MKAEFTISKDEVKKAVESHIKLLGPNVQWAESVDAYPGSGGSWTIVLKDAFTIQEEKEQNEWYENYKAEQAKEKAAKLAEVPDASAITIGSAGGIAGGTEPVGGGGGGQAESIDF